MSSGIGQPFRSLAASFKRLAGGGGRRSSVSLERWSDLKRQTSGMLSPKVYGELYALARALPDLDVVEIGGASGAGSIALALGMKESGKRSRIVVAEKLEGGSRVDIGDRDANLKLIEGNFRKFGVEDQILLYPHEVTLENGSAVTALVRGKEIAALIHDADGRVDRDFALFWPFLCEEGAIVIDDYEDKPEKFTAVTARNPQGGVKAVMTYRLTNRLVEWGLLKPDRVVGNTLFGKRPKGADFSRFDRGECERIIESVNRERDAALTAR